MTKIQELKSDLDSLKSVIDESSTSSEEREMLQEAYNDTKKLYEAELAKTKETPVPKAAKPKENVKPTPKFEKGKTFYFTSGSTTTIEKISYRKGVPMYKLSSRKGAITEDALQKLIGKKLFHKKPSEQPKTDAPKPKPVVKKETTEKVEKIEYNWRKKVPAIIADAGKKVVLATEFTAIKISENQSTVMKDEAKKGDYILINEDGHPNAILTSTMADRLMKDSKGSFSKTYVLKSTYDKIKEERDKFEAMFKQAKLAKRKAKKQVKTNTTTTTKKTTPPTPQNKPSSGKPCEADFDDMVAILSNVIGFLEENAMQWHKMYDTKKYKNVTKEIVGVYKTTGKEDTKVLVKVRIWKPGIFKILPTYDDQWYSLCLDKWTLTKMPKGSVSVRGGRKKIVTKHQLNAIYTTHGSKKFNSCLKVYQEAIKCQAEGNCSDELKEKRKLAYKSCGNLGKKFVAHPKRMQLLYDEAKVIYKKGKGSGMKWSESIRKAAQRLKK